MEKLDMLDLQDGQIIGVSTDASEEFESQLARGKACPFSLDPQNHLYVGNWMYMYSKRFKSGELGSYFKHIDTREYLLVPRFATCLIDWAKE